MLVSCIVERLDMMAPPGLKVGGAAHILLHLLLPVHLGLDHLRQVHNILREALALERAAISCFLPLGAVAVGEHLLLLQWNRGLFCGQDFLIVGGDDLLHVWAGGVRELQVLPVEDLAQGPILGEAFVDQGEESCSNVGCRTHRVPT